MPRKTDEELLAEIKHQREAEEKERKPFKKLKDYDESFEGNEQNSDDDEDNEVPEIQPKNQPQVIEREINLALINDKLNFVIMKLQQIK